MLRALIIVIALPPACDNDMLFPPANVRVPDVISAVVPVMLPPIFTSLIRDCVCRLWLAALIVMVAVPEPASILCDNVILLPPINTTKLDAAPLVPRLFPEFVIPADSITGDDMVIVAEPRFTDSDRVIMFPPTNTN